MIGIAISIKDIAEIVYRKENMKKNEEIKKLKEELDYVKKNSVMICGFSNDDDDDGEQAE